MSPESFSLQNKHPQAEPFLVSFLHHRQSLHCSDKEIEDERTECSCCLIFLSVLLMFTICLSYVNLVVCEAVETVDTALKQFNLIHNLSQCMKMLERAARSHSATLPPPPATQCAPQDSPVLLHLHWHCPGRPRQRSPPGRSDSPPLPPLQSLLRRRTGPSSLPGMVHSSNCAAVAAIPVFTPLFSLHPIQLQN